MKHTRLPAHVKPENYTIFLKPDLNGFTFLGQESIELVLKKSATELILHSKELKITEPFCKIKNVVYKAKDLVYNEKNETVTIKFNAKLPKGKGVLSLNFQGVLNDKMRGFYRSRYVHEGKEKHLATTQFEATDARRAFPCFDEPAQKAVFDVSIAVPEGLTAISNTVESQIIEHSPGYKLVKFEPTPKMSTYLLAFIVGDFEFMEAKTKRGVKVRVFTTRGKKHQAKFALMTAVKALEFYEKYFAINYPLPVLDMIAIPDFSSAAMENWGAITYRESALLIDEEKSSLTNKQWVAIVIAHEIAHQWFGNLVTMEWWTHLWLNEGFASYMEYLCVDALFPNWKIWQQYIAERFNSAMELDALSNTHPIEVSVNHPEEISEIFDAVSYAKGSVVIRMLAEYLGAKNFRDGLRYYLKVHSYKNTSTVHLWQAFEKVSKKPVLEIMENWTLKPGYPLIKITEKPKNLLISQSRFYSSALFGKSNHDKNLWQIPLNISFGKKLHEKFLFTQAEMVLPKKNKTWLKFNSGETGLFRTKYPPQMLREIGKAVKTKQLGASDRLGVLRDVFSLAESGHMDAKEALDFVKNYQNESDYNVWLIMAFGLSLIGGIARQIENSEKYKNFALVVFSKILEQTSFKAKSKEESSAVFLRTLVLQQAVKWGHKKTIQKAKSLFASKSVDVNLKAVVYYAVAKDGAQKEHAQFINMYEKESLQSEKDRIGRALTQFSNKKLLLKTLKFAMSSKVRDQDAPFILVGVLKNPDGTSLALDFIFENWKKLSEKYSSGLSMISRLIGAMDNFYSEKDAKKIEKFFKIHKAPGAARSLKQTLEKIRSNADWLRRDGKILQEFLNAL